MSDLIRFVDAGYTMIWREGRLEETLRGLDDDFEWVVPDLPEEPVRRGPDEVIEFFRDWMERFEGLDGRPARMELVYDLDRARRLAGLE
jgi:hypothetical protein